MKKVVYIIIIIICAIFSIYVGYCLAKNEDNKSSSTLVTKQEDIKNKEVDSKKTTPDINNYKNYNKLMIVAHPDDDTIFGGAHLIQDDYTVICVTCGVVKLRLNEFFNAMAYSNDKYEYLSHTDLTKDYHVSNWDSEKDVINQELKQIIESRDWELIVAHNPEGEYGHKHHKMISQMVTQNVKDKSKLYYFGKFKAKGTIDDTPTLDKEILKKKKEMLAIYKSQPSCTDKGNLTYAFDHENWIAYKDWK